MKCSPFLALAVALCLGASLVNAQTEPPQERPMMPELQTSWTPYQAALKAVEADRDQKLKNLDYIYLLNVDKMQKERAAAGDLDGALAAKAEMDRLGARQGTTAEQFKAMNPALQRLRVAYDAALKNYDAEAAKSSAALLQKLLADLEEVQRRITTTGDLDKALKVKAEKERIAAEAAQPRVAPEPVVGSPATAIGSVTIAQATKERPFENGLGMRFVPVPITGRTSGQRVLFSIWETRVKDYELFVTEKKLRWATPGFPQGPTHPAGGMSWDHACDFCAWLTERERQAGRLGKTEQYRLPSDHEWSCAVGIGAQENPAATPEEKSAKIAKVYPWGSAWPPPQGFGNYGGDEVEGHKVDSGEPIIAGYRDAFPYTAPVGSMAPNPFGLFDLGGNIGEWCADRYSPTKGVHVIRGEDFRGGSPLRACHAL